MILSYPGLIPNKGSFTLSLGSPEGQALEKAFEQAYTQLQELASPYGITTIPMPTRAYARLYQATPSKSTKTLEVTYIFLGRRAPLPYEFDDEAWEDQSYPSMPPKTVKSVKAAYVGYKLPAPYPLDEDLEE